MFDKVKVKSEDVDSGYGEWFKSSEDIDNGKITSMLKWKMNSFKKENKSRRHW